MRHRWDFDAADIKLVKDLVKRMDGHSLVRQRYDLNLADPKPPVTRERFWHVMIGCLLTSQQNSSDDSPIMRFWSTEPFPLSLKVCEGGCDLVATTATMLKQFGGIRYYDNIAKYMNENLPQVQGEEWQGCVGQLDRLHTAQPAKVEREVANFIDGHLSGFGPKQSRNLLQWLGLTRYEIPIDSRVTGWLNDNGFPLPLSSGLLGFSDYYEFIEDGLQELCRLCEIYPCVLDAAIFVSLEKPQV